MLKRERSGVEHTFLIQFKAMSLVSFTHSLREAVYPQQHRRAKVAGMPISVKDLDVGELGKVKLFVSFPCPNLGE